MAPMKVRCPLCGAENDPRGLSNHKGNKVCKRIQRARGVSVVESESEIDSPRYEENNEETDTDPEPESDKAEINETTVGNDTSDIEVLDMSETNNDSGNDPEEMDLSDNGDNSGDLECPDCGNSEPITTSQARKDFRNEMGGIPAETDRQLSNHENVCPECNEIW